MAEAEEMEKTMEMTETACPSTTMTITETGSSQASEPLVLTLRKPKTDKKVQWQEGVVDNEFMGKKSSKCCCIYSKPHKFGESDSEDDSGEGGCGDDDCCHEHRVARKRVPRKNPPSQDGSMPPPSSSSAE